MFESKTVKRGNSLALTLPSGAGFKEGQKWLLVPEKDGQSYTLVPKIANPFENIADGALYQPEEWPDTRLPEVD